VGAKTKHVPMRRCAACGAQEAKGRLLRVVREPDGAVGLDTGGKRSGRGAYLCPNAACLEAGLAKGRIDYVLKRPLAADERQRLRQALEAAFAEEALR
jgi:predicted RNA-binding protein YlxR (DUF448 family)